METNGQEKPVALASHSLTKTQRGYAQIEREALAIIFGVPKFHKYLYSRMFTLQTDHDSTNYDLREFKIHDGVSSYKFQGGAEKWKYGFVVKWLRPLNYLVKIGNQTKKVYVDHMLPNSLTEKDLKKMTPLRIWILFH